MNTDNGGVITTVSKNINGFDCSVVVTDTNIHVRVDAGKTIHVFTFIRGEETIRMIKRTIDAATKKETLNYGPQDEIRKDI